MSRFEIYSGNNTAGASSAGNRGFGNIDPTIPHGDTLPVGIYENGSLFFRTSDNTLWVCENGLFILVSG